MCHKLGAAGYRSTASMDSTALPEAAECWGLTATGPAWPAQKLRVLLELLLLQKGPDSFPGTW